MSDYFPNDYYAADYFPDGYFGPLEVIVVPLEAPITGRIAPLLVGEADVPGHPILALVELGPEAEDERGHLAAAATGRVVLAAIHEDEGVITGRIAVAVVGQPGARGRPRVAADERGAEAEGERGETEQVETGVS